MMEIPLKINEIENHINAVLYSDITRIKKAYLKKNEKKLDLTKLC
jgi:hypothetical protein